MYTLPALDRARRWQVSPSGPGNVLLRALDRASRGSAPVCSRPSSPTRKMPSCAVANRRWQLSRIFSNTGAVSATELLMTCSTSAVAVCCSSASLVSLNRRAFWIAITAWSAKVLSRSAWRCGVLPGSAPGDDDDADRHAVPQQRRADHAPPVAGRRRQPVVRRIGERVLQICTWPEADDPTAQHLGTRRRRGRSGARPRSPPAASCRWPRVSTMWPS